MGSCTVSEGGSFVSDAASSSSMGTEVWRLVGTISKCACLFEAAVNSVMHSQQIHWQGIQDCMGAGVT